MSESCGNCRFWGRGEGPKGVCRIEHPKIILTRINQESGEVDVTAGFPPIDEVGWCGEWKPRKGDLN